MEQLEQEPEGEKVEYFSEERPQRVEEYSSLREDDTVELKCSSVFLPILSSSSPSFSETYSTTQQQDSLPQLETKSQMKFIPDTLMQSLANKSERSTRMRHNKDTIRAFLKWHDRRDRPVFTLRRRPEASPDFSLPPI